jgi:flavin-dependent dehydrogenase
VIEVLIIGAGPAGSAAAIHLARAGREVLLVDRARFPRPKPCGEYFNPECWRLLRELGLFPALEAAGARRVTALSLGVPGSRSLTVPFAPLLPAGATAFSLDRETLDHTLVNTARAAGATVWEETLVREPLVERGRVIGAVMRQDGIDREVRAGITLAADGLRSRFARMLGLARGDGGRRKFGVTARYATCAADGERVEMHASGPGCCGLVTRGLVANLGMVVDGNRIREVGGDPAGFFARALESFPALAGYLSGEPPAVQTVGPLTWLTHRQAVAGCLLLGDAAGFYDPFTGQGVTFALLTAALAADVAERALAEGDVSEARLAEYARRRRALLEPKIAVQKIIQAVLERPRLREHVLARLQARAPTAQTLVGIVADILPAYRALSPAFLAGLLA